MVAVVRCAPSSELGGADVGVEGIVGGDVDGVGGGVGDGVGERVLRELPGRRDGRVTPARVRRRREGRGGVGRHGMRRHGVRGHGTGCHGIRRHGTRRHGPGRHGTGRHVVGRGVVGRGGVGEVGVGAGVVERVVGDARRLGGGGLVGGVVGHDAVEDRQRRRRLPAVLGGVAEATAGGAPGTGAREASGLQDIDKAWRRRAVNPTKFFLST